MTRQIVFLFAFAFLLIMRPSEGHAKPTEDILYGTWTNENQRPQKTVRYQRMFKDHPVLWYTDYALLSDSDPFAEGMEQIVDSWTDSEGNSWFKAIATFISGHAKGDIVFTLQRVNKSRTAFEIEGSFDSGTFPTRIDPSDARYRIFYRVGN